MARYSDTLRDQNGAAIAGALVSVIAYDGSAAALTNDDGSALSNPFYTDALGGYVFNADAGRYTLEFRYGGRLVQRDRDAVVGDLVAAIDPSPANAGKYVALDAAGNATYASGTGADAGLRTDLAAPTGSSLIGFLQSGTGAVARDVGAQLQEMGKSAGGFGAAADGATNDAAALQAGLTAVAQSTEKWPTLRLPRGDMLITSALILTTTRASIEGQGSGNMSQIYASLATGTALTLQNYEGCNESFSVVSGTPGQTEAQARTVARNGIHFDYTGGHGGISDIEARYFNGFGVKITNIWDSRVENPVIVGCGSATEYAFSVLSASDTSNHTNFNRLQVEDSHGRAIYFHEDNINLAVDGIHCEGTISADASDYSVLLLGGTCSFRNARIANDGNVTAANGLNVLVRLGGGKNSYSDFYCEAGTIVDYFWGSASKEFASRIENSRFDTLRLPAANVGAVHLENCYIATLELYDQAATLVLENCTVGNITVSGNTTDVTFIGGEVTGAWTIVGNPTVRARAGTTFTNMPATLTVTLDGCTVTNAVTTVFNQQLVAENTEFAAGITLDGNGALVWLNDCTVTGNLGYGAGTAFGACSGGTRVAGTIHANWYGTGGTWPEKVVRWRLDAAAGQVLFHLWNGAAFVAGPNAA